MYFDDGPMPPEKCETCEKRLDVWPENEDAWMLFHRCRDQIIIAEGGYIIGPRHDVLWKWVDEYDADGLLDESRLETMDKILLVFDVYHGEHNREVGRKIDAARNKHGK